MKSIKALTLFVSLLFGSNFAQAKKNAVTHDNQDSAFQAECNGSDENKGHGYVLDIAFSYTYHCKSGHGERFKFSFSYDATKHNELKNEQVDIGERFVRTISSENSLVYKIVFLKKKVFGDEVDFYIQVPKRLSSAAKVVFCKSNPSLARLDTNCGEEVYRVDSRDLFYNGNAARLPSAVKDESEELSQLMKTVYQLRTPPKADSIANN